MREVVNRQMVEETIQTIKETEREAEEIIKDADARCAGILEEASKKAAKIKEDAVRDAKEKAEASLSSVKEVGTQTMQDALKETEEQIASLRGTALAKEDAAVSAVIARLV